MVAQLVKEEGILSFSNIRKEMIDLVGGRGLTSANSLARGSEYPLALFSPLKLIDISWIIII